MMFAKIFRFIFQLMGIQGYGRSMVVESNNRGEVTIRWNDSDYPDIHIPARVRVTDLPGEDTGNKQRFRFLSVSDKTPLRSLDFSIYRPYCPETWSIGVNGGSLHTGISGKMSKWVYPYQIPGERDCTVFVDSRDYGRLKWLNRLLRNWRYNRSCTVTELNVDLWSPRPKGELENWAASALAGDV